jgi:hypothetical protein
MVCSPQGILPCSLKGCNSIAQDEILGSGKSLWVKGYFFQKLGSRITRTV